MTFSKIVATLYSRFVEMWVNMPFLIAHPYLLIQTHSPAPAEVQLGQVLHMLNVSLFRALLVHQPESSKKPGAFCMSLSL